MIKVNINSEQRKKLERFRSLASSKDSEKVLMVPLSSEVKKLGLYHSCGTGSAASCLIFR